MTSPSKTSSTSSADCPAGHIKPSQTGSCSQTTFGAILGREKIFEFLAKCTADKNSLVITPLSWRDATTGNPKAVSEDAVDLRLGTDFFILRSDRLPAQIPGVTLGHEFQRPVHVPLGRYLVVPGHQTVLAATLEYIKLPPILSAMVLTKSSWARSFITIETAPWVHPNWRGCLTLEIANHSEVPFILYPGYRIAQLVLFKVDHGTNELSPEPSARYLGPTKPEPPSINPPFRALAELGIPRDQVQPPPGVSQDLPTSESTAIVVPGGLFRK